VKGTKEIIGRTVPVNNKNLRCLGRIVLQVQISVFLIELQQTSDCGYNLHRRMVHGGFAEEAKNLTWCFIMPDLP
jgi:hypothetical protein